MKPHGTCCSGTVVDNEQYGCCAKGINFFWESYGLTYDGIMYNMELWMCCQGRASSGVYFALSGVEECRINKTKRRRFVKVIERSEYVKEVDGGQKEATDDV